MKLRPYDWFYNCARPVPMHVRPSIESHVLVNAHMSR